MTDRKPVTAWAHLINGKVYGTNHDKDGADGVAEILACFKGHKVDTVELVEKTPDCVWNPDRIEGAFIPTCQPTFKCFLDSSAKFCCYCGGKLKLENGK